MTILLKSLLVSFKLVVRVILYMHEYSHCGTHILSQCDTHVFIYDKVIDVTLNKSL